MLNFRSFITIICCMSQLSMACPEMAKVKTNDPAKCDGWFVKEEKMQEIAKDKQQADLVRKENILLKDLSYTNERIIEFEKNRSNSLQKELSWEQTKSNWKSMGFFVLGVVLTGVASYAAIQSTR